MGRAYSNDLRERVAASVLGGRSCRETAALFGVSVASAVKWSQRLRASGSAAAKPMGHKRGRSLTAEKGFIAARLKADVTLRGLVRELADRGIRTSYISVWRVVHEEGLSFKKSLFASEQERPDVARRRARWKAHQAKLDPSRLVFIDETLGSSPRAGSGPRPTWPDWPVGVSRAGG